MEDKLTVRAIRVIGIVLLVAAPSLAVEKEISLQRELRRIEQVWHQRSAPADSGVVASEQYHHAHLEADAAARWSLGGHATLGVLGGLLGIAFVLASHRRTG